MQELLMVQSNLESTVSQLGNIGEEIAALTISIQEKTTVLDELAQVIHNNRTTAVPLLSNQLIAIRMRNVRFDIKVRSARNLP
jgi:DNA repair protein RecN (Recombination protein N)